MQKEVPVYGNKKYADFAWKRPVHFKIQNINDTRISCNAHNNRNKTSSLTSEQEEHNINTNNQQIINSHDGCPWSTIDDSSYFLLVMVINPPSPPLNEMDLH